METVEIRFGLVSEGASDHLILYSLLHAHFALLGRKVTVNYLAPPPLASDATKREPFGWTEVINYCRTERILEALQFNDYIIVQIDTDTCEEAGFDVSRRREDGTLLSDAELVAAVIVRLRREMPESVLAMVEERVIFAITVNEIECWLLPWFSDKASDASKTVGCLGALNLILTRQYQFSIDKQKKDTRYYKKALQAAQMGKDKRFRKRASGQKSLEIFLASVTAKVEAHMKADTGKGTEGE